MGKELLSNKELEKLMAIAKEQGIIMIQDDVEPDITAYSYEGEKIRPFDPSKINITMKPLTLDALLKRLKNKEIEFDTSFQRRAGLWSKGQKSQLIESIFLRIPLPAFYFDATDEGKWLIIDGLQRITALKEFVVEKELVLQELEFFPELNGCRFDMLPRMFQRRIDETVIYVYLVNPSTPKNVKFNIFKRINTGGLALEAQEIRNALFQGNATTFLSECSKMDCFLKVTSGSITTDRMLDREFVLRYVSFCYLDLNLYNGNVNEFLNEGMKYLNCISSEVTQIIKKEFQFVMESIYGIMEGNAFRKICADGRRRPINKVIFESWCYVLRKLTEDEVKQLILIKECIQRKYMALCESADYLYLLKAPDKKAVYARIEKLHDLLNQALRER